MKTLKDQNKKLSISKFQISKIHNSQSIMGGKNLNLNNGGDDDSSVDTKNGRTH